MMTRTAFVTSIWFLSLCAGAVHAAPDSPLVAVDFEKQISPIFEVNCIKCHGPEKQKGKLRLDARSFAFTADESTWTIKPGKSADSELYRRIALPADDLDLMPEDGKKLSDIEIDLIKRWIDEGARWPETGKPEVGTVPRGPETFELRELDEAEKAAQAKAIAALKERGALAGRVAASTAALDVSFGLLGDDITDKDVVLLSGLEPNLVWLNFARTKITDAGIAPLANFKELRRLHLEGTALGDAALKHVAGLSNLQYLNLYGTKVTDAGLQSLTKLTNLRKLYLWQTGVTDEGVAGLEKSLPGLRIYRGLALKPPPEPKEKDGATPVAAVAQCCAKAKAAGKECDHPCCVEAAKEGKPCPKCTPKPEKKEAKEVGEKKPKLPGCCAKAKENGKECDHPCCVEAAKEGKLCEKCAG